LSRRHDVSQPLVYTFRIRKTHFSSNISSGWAGVEVGSIEQLIQTYNMDITHHESATYQFTVDSLNLKPGRYTMSLFVRANEEIQDWLEGAAMIEIEDGNIYGFENSQMIQGLVQPQFHFEQIV